MESKLKSGTTLIVDRYSYSGVAFSSAKGLDFEWCKVTTCLKLFFNEVFVIHLILNNKLASNRLQKLGCWLQMWCYT